MNATATVALPPSVRSLRAIANRVNRRFVGRADTINLACVAVIAEAPMVIVGPPGTAKTALFTEFAGLVGPTFAWQMTRYTTPDELFGPVSLAGLREDRMDRARGGKLAGASAVVLDEAFKANSATLNAQLGALNERQHEGTPCEWRAWFGLSNEYPDGIQPGTVSDGDFLGALWDRYLIRAEVGYLTSDADWEEMMFGSAASSAPSAAPLTLPELDDLRRLRDGVRVTAETCDALLRLRHRLAAAGLAVSDRRWKASLRIMQAQAVLRGRSETRPADLRVLASVLWDKLDERGKIAEAVVECAGGIASAVLAMESEIEQQARHFHAATGAAKAATAHTVVGRLAAHERALEHLRQTADEEDAGELERVMDRLREFKHDIQQAVLSSLRGAAS